LRAHEVGGGELPGFARTLCVSAVFEGHGVHGAVARKQLRVEWPCISRGGRCHRLKTTALLLLQLQPVLAYCRSLQGLDAGWILDHAISCSG